MYLLVFVTEISGPFGIRSMHSLPEAPAFGALPPMAQARFSTGGTRSNCLADVVRLGCEIVVYEWTLGRSG